MSNAGSTAQDGSFKDRERGEEARYIHEKEQAQLAALRDAQSKTSSTTTADDGEKKRQERDFEGGFGGQEDLEDRYATTSGEH